MNMVLPVKDSKPDLKKKLEAKRFREVLVRFSKAPSHLNPIYFNGI